ncbi:hypothetical protein CI610_02850 [invertebrate metagenome]|uniref:Uncharacterized protein n=1 Tax=invertebrate metagenome TaxID=1711999 RepID=A0A2H9T4S9_9ZZZZ
MKLSSVEELESVKVKVTCLTEVISDIKQSLQTQTSDKGAGKDITRILTSNSFIFHVNPGTRKSKYGYLRL